MVDDGGGGADADICGDAVAATVAAAATAAAAAADAADTAAVDPNDNAPK